MTQEIIPAYSTFQKDIDLTLYHAFAELIVQTAQDGEARILYRQLEARQIWQEDQNVSSYFEAYSLRYPGEVLERFEEKLGTDIRILRALALALGYTRRCQADTMFVHKLLDQLAHLALVVGDQYSQHPQFPPVSPESNIISLYPAWDISVNPYELLPFAFLVRPFIST